jgi:hypothetical protein
MHAVNPLARITPRRAPPVPDPTSRQEWRGSRSFLGIAVDPTQGSCSDGSGIERAHNLRRI